MGRGGGAGQGMGHNGGIVSYFWRIFNYDFLIVLQFVVD